jgi:hypothetical protein
MKDRSEKQKPRKNKKWETKAKQELKAKDKNE